MRNGRLRILGLVLPALLATSAGATPIAELVFVASSGAGAPGTSTIQAEPGDLLTAEIRVTAGPEGVSAYGISLEFDVDLGDELDVVSVTELLPPGFSFSFTPGVARIQESAATRPGRVLTFEGATLGLGPANRTFVIGELVLRVTDALATDGADLVLGLWNPGVDGLFDNAGADLAPSASFGSASIVALPEPASALLVALGLAALARLRRFAP